MDRFLLIFQRPAVYRKGAETEVNSDNESESQWKKGRTEAGNRMKAVPQPLKNVMIEHEESERKNTGLELLVKKE